MPSKRIGIVALVAFGLALLGSSPALATAPGPNGRIAFVKGNDIYTVNPDGTGLKQLTKTSSLSEADPAYSPDGNYIAFTRTAPPISGSLIYVMRSDGTEPHRVASVDGANYLSWSPDGTKLAFFRNLSSGNGIWTINADGSGLMNLITDDTAGPPSWSPDGTKIAFSRGSFSEIWTMNANGSGLTRLTFSALGVDNRWANWSPDGSKIVFSSDAACVHCDLYDLYTVPSNGGAVTRLTNSFAGTKLDPVWSPDGTKLAFMSCPDPDAGCVGDLYLMNSDGSGVAVLQGGPQDESQPDWQPAVGPPLVPIPDALDKIAFVSTRDHPGSGSNADEIYTMNPDGTLQRALTDNSFPDDGPKWSPGGTKIAFTRPGTTFDVYVMNADGSGQSNITQSSGVDEFSPAWSPDGTRIAFTRDDGSDHEQLWVMQADGSAQTQLTSGSRDESASWSPDGTKIAFSGGGAIYTVKPDGTGLTPLTTAPTDGRDDFPDWSPDGTKIAFSRFLPIPSGGSRSQIWTMNANGTAQQQVTSASNGAVFPSWSPDGSQIAFTQNNQIHVMSPDGSGARSLMDPFEDGSRPDWRPVAGYARPRGATPLYASLVTAYKQCTGPTSTHGAPLSFPSCPGPQLTSDYLTAGTPDSNGKRTTMEAYLRMDVQVGNPATPADEADVTLKLHANDVFTKALADYTGELRALVSVRITDRDSARNATTIDFPFGFNASCVADPDTTVGSSCDVTTSADAVTPGAIKEGKRAVWALDKVRVFDGGTDGDADTAADNTLFLTQGVFVP